MLCTRAEEPFAPSSFAGPHLVRREGGFAGSGMLCFKRWVPMLDGVFIWERVIHIEERDGKVTPAGSPPVTLMIMGLLLIDVSSYRLAIFLLLA